MAYLEYIESIPLPHLGKDVACQVYSSSRARRSWLRLCSEKGLRIIIPRRIKDKRHAAEKMLANFNDWVVKNWQKAQKRCLEEVIIPEYMEVGGNRIDQNGIFNFAKSSLIGRVEEMATTNGFSYNKICVRSKKRSWGSCTRKRNISLNWKIFFLMPEVRDYVIYHELAHLREFNHSKNFWHEVEKLCPNYKECNKELKQFIC